MHPYLVPCFRFVKERGRGGLWSCGEEGDKGEEGGSTENGHVGSINMHVDVLTDLPHFLVE